MIAWDPFLLVRWRTRVVTVIIIQERHSSAQIIKKGRCCVVNGAQAHSHEGPIIKGSAIGAILGARERDESFSQREGWVFRRIARSPTNITPHPPTTVVAQAGVCKERWVLIARDKERMIREEQKNFLGSVAEPCSFWINSQGFYSKPQR